MIEGLPTVERLERRPGASDFDVYLLPREN
jgi:hypothetical protein